MATVTNPTGWCLYSSPINRSIDIGETVELDEETADAVCASGVFVRVEEPEPTRKRSRRGSEIVEEAVESERETR